jgi:hypothetical protein
MFNEFSLIRTSIESFNYYKKLVKSYGKKKSGKIWSL